MSVLRVVKAAVIAIGVSVLCLLPPGIHFVSGPLGPLIGGWVAGHVTRLRAGEAALLGLLLGLLVGLPAPILLEELHVVSIGGPAVAFFAIIGAIYFGVLGGVAAGIGGHSAHEDARQEASRVREEEQSRVS